MDLMHRIKVDFPEPEGPMMTDFSPSFYSQINIFQDLQVTEISFQMFDFTMSAISFTFQSCR